MMNVARYTNTLSSSSCNHSKVIKLPKPNDVVSWTYLISSTANSPLSLHHFISMLRQPTTPNHRTLAVLLKTCAALPSPSFGLLLHTLSLKLSLSSSPYTASALISFYSKLRLPHHARNLFDEIPQRDEVCFSTLIVGLTQNKLSGDALRCFAAMRTEGFRCSTYSLSAALRAAAELAALEQCRIIHGHCVVTGFDNNVVVRTALVDGYGKCGVVVEARRVFDEVLWSLSVIGWNAMMSGYAQQGEYGLVMELFRYMRVRGIVPDEFSFLAVLTAFWNAGLANEVEVWLWKMKAEYGLEAWIEHYTCLVGALGRVGRFEDAERVVLTMPYKPDAAVWRTLLSTCAYSGEADLALVMSKRLLEINPYDDSAYVIAANVLGSVGRFDEAREVRKLMRVGQVSKQGGKSWIELQGEVHVFLAGDKRHEMTEQIYAKLVELREEIVKLGYVPVYDDKFNEVKEEKLEALWYHSEKLALAFGLVSGAAPPGKAFRIVKNLRICRDCHEVFKYVSRVVKREIIIRDANRYHKILDGCCNCGDFW